MISIVIPNYNGRKLLRANLPSVVKAVREEGKAEIIVVDDASPDDSVDVLRREFPSVRVIALEENVGFGKACMRGAREARGEILLFLNTDVSVSVDFLGPLREDMSDRSVFAVSAVDETRLTPDHPHEMNGLCMRRGLIGMTRLLPTGEPPFEIAYASGGYSAYRKEMFMALGGFDPILEPFYWEDVDISYRAWKRGWRSVVEPRSRVRHERDHSSISTAHGRRRVKHVYRRNKFLLTWKNITSWRMFLFRHVLPTALHVVTRWIILDFGYYRALGAAMRRLPMALARRREERAAQKITDRELFMRLSCPRACATRADAMVSTEPGR